MQIKGKERYENTDPDAQKLCGHSRRGDVNRSINNLIWHQIRNVAILRHLTIIKHRRCVVLQRERKKGEKKKKETKNKQKTLSKNLIISRVRSKTKGQEPYHYHQAILLDTQVNNTRQIKLRKRLSSLPASSFLSTRYPPPNHENSRKKKEKEKTKTTTTTTTKPIYWTPELSETTDLIPWLSRFLKRSKHDKQRRGEYIKGQRCLGPLELRPRASSSSSSSSSSSIPRRAMDTIRSNFD